jgi:LPXTG-motif cell wall-anchored protein
VAVVADEEDLASTGFNGGWLVALAAALLLGGGALLLVMRLRTRR